MSCSTSWYPGPRAAGPFPRRSVEIAAIVGGFFFAWPAAVAYVAWKIAGYPYLDEMREFAARARGGRAFAGTPFAAFGSGAFREGFRGGWGGGRGGSGNAAFEAYRRSELDRLEAERRRLDEEGREFARFVEELKRAKDREEFDAFMARRRGAEAGTVHSV